MRHQGELVDGEIDYLFLSQAKYDQKDRLRQVVAKIDELEERGHSVYASTTIGGLGGTDEFAPIDNCLTIVTLKVD